MPPKARPQGRDRVWCSPGCRSRSLRSERRVKVCAACGCELGHRANATDGPSYCRSCRARGAARVRQPAGTCCECGAPKPSARHVYCVTCRKKQRNAPGGKHPPGSSALLGYGRRHRKQRLAALASFRFGDPCARCGQPMLDPPEKLDLDHTDDRTGYLGLSHASCNRRHTRAPIGEHPRTCEGCGIPYVATAREQRYCSQACYHQHRPKRAAKPKPVRPPKSSVWFKTCEHCASLFAARRSVTRFCGKRCEDAAYRARNRQPVTFHECTGCGCVIPPTRHKCDACIRTTKRARKRRELDMRHQTPGAGVDRSAA